MRTTVVYLYEVGCAVWMHGVNTGEVGNGVWSVGGHSMDGSVSGEIGISEHAGVEGAVGVLGEERFLGRGEVESAQVRENEGDG